MRESWKRVHCVANVSNQYVTWYTKPLPKAFNNILSAQVLSKGSNDALNVTVYHVNVWSSSGKKVDRFSCKSCKSDLLSHVHQLHTHPQRTKKCTSTLMLQPSHYISVYSRSHSDIDVYSLAQGHISSLWTHTHIQTPTHTHCRVVISNCTVQQKWSNQHQCELN